MPKAILFDAPSTEAKKIYILGAGYPVEVIVNLGEWIKVRDHLGTLSWIQGKQLSTRRTLLVIADKAEVKQADEDGAALVATLEKDVVVEIVPATTKGGWLKIKHKDGLSGYIHATDVWGN